MAIVQALIAFVGRSFGKILSALFDWAVVAIFGHASGTEKIFLSALLAGSRRLAGPPAGHRGAEGRGLRAGARADPVLGSVLGHPLVLDRPGARGAAGVGAAMAARQPADRPRRSWPVRLLRGFPITAGLSAALLITLVTVPALRLVSAARRRKDAQVPLLTDAASYGQVAQRVPVILAEHGRTVRRASPPWWLTAPLRVLSAMDHDAFQSRIPADLAYFEGRDLVLALYPSGLLIRGRPDALASAHGLIVEGMSDLDVCQTSDPRAQDIERRIARVWQTRGAARTGPVSAARLREIVKAIEALPVEYDEWQIVYRKALQLSRALDGKPQLLAGLVHPEETMQRYEERAPVTESNGHGRKNGETSTRALVGQIGGQLIELAQTEVELARAELASDMRAGRRTVMGLGVAAVAAIAGVNLLLVAVVLALVALMPGWLAALAVAAVVFARERDGRVSRRGGAPALAAGAHAEISQGGLGMAEGPGRRDRGRRGDRAGSGAHRGRDRAAAPGAHLAR